MTKFTRILAPLFLIGWMILIFCLSNQTADVSDNTSGSLIKAVVSIFLEGFEDLSEAKQQEIIEPFQFIVRKGAHFTAYFILGIFAFLSFGTYKSLPLPLRAILSLIICILYSVSDEIHQLYIPGRSGEVRDVLIDSCGSLLSVLIFFLIFRSAERKAYNKLSKGGTMRKKDLIKLNEELFKRHETAALALEESRQEIKELKSEIIKLKGELERLTAEAKEASPLKNLEDKILSAASVSDDKKYGAEIIGKIVVSAARHCNQLTASGEGSDVKELVNLILGRTEIAKAEILNITEAQCGIDEKKTLIDAQKAECEDYFQSIMGQR